ncbi:Hsp20/alpha crystallin family protein [Acidobacteria bacterium AB60]|nr:Hsp20/alpha crystallin family protein [Acidobacteria bacterium AB60]
MTAQSEHTTSAATSQEQGQRSAQSVVTQDVLVPDPPLVFSPHDLFRFGPFALMRRIMDDLDRTAHEVGLARSGRNTTRWTPAIEVAEKEGEYCIRAEVPGVKPENLRVETTNDSLIIEGERRTDQEDKREDVRLTERQYGHFFRSIPLPEGANLDQAKATFRNGVLEVTIPIPQRASQRRSIPIETDSAAPPPSSRPDAQMQGA